MSFDLVRLQRFLSVYRHLSFSRAAEELGVTHSALTKSIQQLEFELDIQLFERSTRSVSPTQTADRLAKRASDLITFAATVRDEVTSAQQRLRLIVGPAIIEGGLAEAVLAFGKDRPEVPLSIETMPPELGAERLSRHEVDGLIYHSGSISALPNRSGLKIISIFEEPYWVVMRMGHPAARHKGAFETLLQYEWAVAGFDRVFQNSLPAQTRRQLEVAGYPKYRILSQAACLALVAKSDLLTSLPRSRAMLEAKRLDLAAMPMHGEASFSVSTATLAGARTNPDFEEFIGYFLDALSA